MDVRTIFEKVDSAYADYKTHECLIETRMWDSNNPEVAYSTKKAYLEKTKDSPHGFKFHIAQFTLKRTVIYDGNHSTFINHRYGNYSHYKDHLGTGIHIGNSPYIGFFTDGFIKAIINNKEFESELLSDTTIQHVPCYHIVFRVAYDKELGYYNEYHYYIQKDNFYCKALKTKNYHGSDFTWQEMNIEVGVVNREIDKKLFKFRNHIRTYYKKLKHENSKPKKLIKRGKKVPKFEGLTIENKKFSRDDFNGKITIIDFWYSSCPPCRKAAPILDSIAMVYNDSLVQVIGMNPYDGTEYIHRYANQRYKAISQIFISEKIVNKFKVTSYPSFYVIDQNGKVAFSKEGFSGELYTELTNEIEKLLKPDH